MFHSQRAKNIQNINECMGFAFQCCCFSSHTLLCANSKNKSGCVLEISAEFLAHAGILYKLKNGCGRQRNMCEVPEKRQQDEGGKETNNLTASPERQMT